MKITTSDYRDAWNIIIEERYERGLTETVRNIVVHQKKILCNMGMSCLSE